jgi:hypothetical protein
LAKATVYPTFAKGRYAASTARRDPQTKGASTLLPSRERKMSREERRGSQRINFARPTEAQGELYQGLKAHQSDLETQQDAAAPACGLADRIEATRRVLQWLDYQAFEIEPQALPSSRWISHSGDTPTDSVV